MFVPPLLWEFARKLMSQEHQREPIRFTGDFSNWETALRQTTGYAEPVILERTRAALVRVRDGLAPGERDSLILPEPDSPQGVLAALLRAAAERDGKLRVLDFGGSLGSTFFQCRGYLKVLSELHWIIVEQPAVVACGQAEFSNNQLSFAADLESVLQAADPPDVVVLSSVLSYIPAPHELLERLVRQRVRYIVIDRTACWSGNRDRLAIQYIPEWIYPASYPAWFFVESGLHAHFASDYDRIASYASADQPLLPDAAAYSRGMCYRVRHE